MVSSMGRIVTRIVSLIHELRSCHSFSRLQGLVPKNLKAKAGLGPAGRLL
jgi:hypothetical protein